MGNEGVRMHVGPHVVRAVELMGTQCQSLENGLRDMHWECDRSV
jgi:hypothetical protein